MMSWPQCVSLNKIQCYGDTGSRDNPDDET